MADSINDDLNPVKQLESWDVGKAKRFLDAPEPKDHKYRRGVIGCMTGSRRYPGAALMTTAAALATGVGMVRYFGATSIGREAIQFRPAVVLGNGKVDALLLGSGISDNLFSRLRLSKAVKQEVPKILDAIAIELVKKSDSRTIITPHAGELAKLIGISSLEIEKRPDHYARLTAREFQVTVLLKGWQTIVANPTRVISLPPAPTWLATAGTGDVLAGILGGLVAINHAQVTVDNLIEIAATAALVHALAAKQASNGPLDIEAMINQIPEVIYKIARG
ncbi:MAG: NAD(P)H-hydrate dehydratase [Candidatus Nanopelagicaceae bacterium]